MAAEVEFTVGSTKRAERASLSLDPAAKALLARVHDTLRVAPLPDGDLKTLFDDAVLYDDGDIVLIYRVDIDQHKVTVVAIAAK